MVVPGGSCLAREGQTNSGQGWLERSRKAPPLPRVSDTEHRTPEEPASLRYCGATFAGSFAPFRGHGPLAQGNFLQAWLPQGLFPQTELRRKVRAVSLTRGGGRFASARCRAGLPRTVFGQGWPNPSLQIPSCPSTGSGHSHLGDGVGRHPITRRVETPTAFQYSVHDVEQLAHAGHDDLFGPLAVRA